MDMVLVIVIPIIVNKKILTAPEMNKQCRVFWGTPVILILN